MYRLVSIYKLYFQYFTKYLQSNYACLMINDIGNYIKLKLSQNVVIYELYIKSSQTVIMNIEVTNKCNNS